MRKMFILLNKPILAGKQFGRDQRKLHPCQPGWKTNPILRNNLVQKQRENRQTDTATVVNILHGDGIKYDPLIWRITG